MLVYLNVDSLFNTLQLIVVHYTFADFFDPFFLFNQEKQSTHHSILLRW